MLSTAFHNYQRDVLSRNPAGDSDIIRYGSDYRTDAFSSPNSGVLTNSSVRSSSSTFRHPCLTFSNSPGCDLLSMLPIWPVSFPASQTHQPHSAQVTRPSHLIQPSPNASCASKLTLSTSHLSSQFQSVKLFIKSIRNTTITIHIDSTSSISDLKHLIYSHDGVPLCDLRLLHGGCELRDDALLSGLDVDGATITCLLRVLGGNPCHRIPLRWWLGFSRSYEDGRAGEEGRICHVLSEIEFRLVPPHNWYSDLPLSDWYGIQLHSGHEITGISKIMLLKSLIISLPKTIGNLTSLTKLDVSENQLTLLPDSIGKLLSLTHLNVDLNQLTKLPDSIKKLPCLEYLGVYYNPMTFTNARCRKVESRFERAGLTVDVNGPADHSHDSDGIDYYNDYK